METILINEELFRENSPIKDDTIVTKLVPYMLYYIFNLHQTTTSTSANISGERCIISLIYIKPQRRADYALVMRRLRGNCICRKPYIRTPAKRL